MGWMESQANQHIVLKGCEKKYRIRRPQHDFVIRSAEREYGSSHPPRNEDVMAGEKKKRSLQIWNLKALKFWNMFVFFSACIIGLISVKLTIACYL